MNYQGDFLEDATVYIPFNTFDSNDPSASVTITDLATGDVEIWKDGVVQTTPGSGVTLTLNIGTNNGTHLIAVDTSNTTDDSFYVINADYQVRINGTTIDGATVNAWVGTFSIENRFKEVDLVSINGIATQLQMLMDASTTVNADADLTGVVVDKSVLSHVMTIDADTDKYNATEDSLEAAGIDNDAIKAETVLIVADTGELQGDDIPGTLSTNDTNVDAQLAAIKAETVLIVEDTNAIQGKLPTNKFMGSSDGADDDGNINDILADTGELQVDDYPTSIAAIQTVVDALETLTEAAGDGDLAAIKVITDALTAAGAAKLALGATTMITGIVSYENHDATTTVIYSDTIDEATADHFNGRLFVPTGAGNALLGQYTEIEDYALDGAEGKFTVTAMTEPPADNSTFVIL